MVTTTTSYIIGLLGNAFTTTYKQAFPVYETASTTPQPTRTYSEVGLIVGLVVGAFVVLVIIILVLCCRPRHYNGNEKPMRPWRHSVQRVRRYLNKEMSDNSTRSDNNLVGDGSKTVVSDVEVHEYSNHAANDRTFASNNNHLVPTDKHPVAAVKSLPLRSLNADEQSPKAEVAQEEEHPKFEYHSQTLRPPQPLPRPATPTMTSHTLPRTTSSSKSAEATLPSGSFLYETAESGSIDTPYYITPDDNAGIPLSDSIYSTVEDRSPRSPSTQLATSPAQPESSTTFEDLYFEPIDEEEV